MESAEGFNQAARHAALWTLTSLTEENRDYLTSLPLGPLVIDDVVEICHGSPDDEDEYIFEHVDAMEALRGQAQPVCFFGHTHVAVVYWLSAAAFDMILPSPNDAETHLQIQPDRRYLINPGSIGQPRDGDPRAAYATYDSEARWNVVLYRVPYNVAGAQAEDHERGPAGGSGAAAGAGEVGYADSRPPLRSRGGRALALAARALLAALQFGRVRIGGGARTQDPANHDPNAAGWPGCR